MLSLVRSLVTAVALVALLAACGDDDPVASPATDATTRTTAPPASTTTDPGGSGGSGGSQQADLAAARALWDDAGADDYVADVLVVCGECAIATFHPVTIVVESGEVVDSSWAVDIVEDVLPPEPEELARFTVEALFERVRVGLAEGQSLDVTYDAVDGHPTVVDDEGFDDVIDDEVYIEVQELRLG
jgi:hypothetical protein